MKAIRRFTVRPAMPERLAALAALAGNLRWAWHGPTRELFAELAPEAWQESGNDPAAVFAAVSQERLDHLAGDDAFVHRVAELDADLQSYLHEPRWYQGLGDDAPAAIAYFSPEFGITAALPQYSGGLGILAGDHLKSASDLGVPLTGVGLFYRGGYFTQSLSPDGWQQETYPVLDPDGLPLQVVRMPDGTPALITVALPEGEVLSARVWRARVGRVTLLLLDSDIPENTSELCRVTDRLYGGGEEHRLRQELLLGIGGARAVALWAELSGTPAPEVYHMNEGHAGFLGVERIAEFIGAGLTFDEALHVVRASTVFTTHTPVTAGIDRFSIDLVRRYFTGDLLPGVDAADVLKLGAEPEPSGNPNVFNMAYMALRLGERANGVSRLHGQVSREMFRPLWPGFESGDVPIGTITNGVHAPSWTHPELVRLAERSLGTSDTTSADWASQAVSDAELWRSRTVMRRRLVDDARRRVHAGLGGEHGSITPVWLDTLLDPDILTIGFARRVPSYKRLTLMLHDRARLRALLLHPDRPVQIVVAGKAHPADDAGKRLIQELVEFASDAEVRHRIVFLPDYDIHMARTLYPGTDVWLNNPLRPLEACGTSGMKAALNGSLNLSILDGWWNEFYDGDNGWAIPTARDGIGPDERDRLEATALYDLIEHEIAPLFYDRDSDGLPTRWLRRVRHTLATLSAPLSADRMVRQYVDDLYRPSFRSQHALRTDGFTGARDLASWTRRVRTAWSAVSIEHVESGGIDEAPQVGDELRLRAYVDLNGLEPTDVAVEVVHGRVTPDGVLSDTRTLTLEPAERATGNSSDSRLTEVAGVLPFERSGSFGYTVRIIPRHPFLSDGADLGLITTAI